MADTANTDWLRARPNVDGERAATIARERYGVLGDVTELGSQQDRNYRIVPTGAGSGAPTGGIMLKINHPSISEDELDLQFVVSDTLLAAGVTTPAVVPTVDGERRFGLPLGEDTSSWVCAFEVVSGQSLLDAGDLTGARAEELGRLCARTDAALAPVHRPAANRNLQWEMGQAAEVVTTLAPSVPDAERAIVIARAEAAWSALERLRDDLPRQLIHGDLTTDNVMVDASGRLWVIDLGDAVDSWRVADLAILAADVFGRTGSLAITGRVVRGYAAVMPLSDSEIDAIWPMVVLRGAVLAVSGWSQQQIDPGNEYARVRMQHEWNLFVRSADLDAEQVAAQLRVAVGLPHRADIPPYVPLIDGLDVAAVVDLEVRSPLLDRGEWTDPATEDALARAAAGSGAAIFRFGETRLTRVAWDVSTPAPARARLVELWTRPGVVVRAPFAGEARADGDAVELTAAGITLRIDGVEAPATGPVDGGQSLGHVAAAAPGVGRLRVTRRILDAPADASFTGAEGEYETDGAADPSPLLGISSVADPVLATRDQQRRRDRVLGSAAERFYDDPPQFERGWGTRLVSTQGRAYLDLVNNVTAIGHSHPRLADAVGRQMHVLNTNSRFLYQAYADLADKLLAHSPDPSLDVVIPVNSGSEAIELALRLARVATGRRDVIALREAYHGWTTGADAVSTSVFDNPNALASRPDWVHLVDAPNAYRGPFRGPDAGARYAAQVAQLAARLGDEGAGVAAFLSEPVLGNAGGVIPPDGYLAAAYDAVRAAGGLAIADEVQVGYGRLGAAFWGSTMLGAVPDIIATAKAAGNAFPFGAVITRREIVDALAREGMFFSSAAGAPASAVAGSVVLDVIRDERLQDNAARVGAHLKGLLEDVARRRPLIGAVHGTGLYMGVELVRNRETREPAGREAAEVSRRLLDHGIIVQPASERQNVLKVKPPLTFSIDDARAFAAALDAVLGGPDLAPTGE
ncbi:aminotransferase class III-fold pyridoxal phosphate-dependent enzyme [Millisia brevis]|uniref:aminotransferase class III-fold pyridoxal phosphate-dependent enzyme n=1 Tax=Millisia brevis TaxID=264148 RepID=UPI000830A018|nr:aminotransferase class III-fold pyridoxal phosphate-dependent enzyme [Millisia brevis]